jgi:hypothetical protein
LKNGRAIDQAISRQRLTEESQDQSQATPFGIYGGQGGKGTGFSPSTSLFRWHYYSTNGAFSFTRLSSMLHYLSN